MCFFFSACSPHHFTLAHILLDAFNLEVCDSSSYCSINGSHNLIFHPLMLQELHITLLAVHDGKRRSPVTVHMYPLCKKVQFKDKNKVNKTNITNVTFQFSFPEKTLRFPAPKAIFYIKYLYFIWKLTLLYLQKRHIHTHRHKNCNNKHTTCKTVQFKHEIIKIFK